MDPIMQVQENRDEMYALINEQRRAIDEQIVRNIEDSEEFSVNALMDAECEGRMNAEQRRLMDCYQSRKQEYERELRELEQRRNEPDWILKYNAKRIQAEQNDMEMRLMMASALGRGPVEKRIRAECLANIIRCRERILEYYRDQQDLERNQERNRDEQMAEIAKERAIQGKTVAEFNLIVLTRAALARIQEERNQQEDAAEIMRAFLNADFSTKALEADYVIQNLEDCLHNVELIRRAEEMAPEHRGNMAEDAYAPVRQKLEAVREYVNAVESVLWEYGLTIDYDALQIREINRNDEAFAKRRRAYWTNGVTRFYFGARRYRHREENGERVLGDNQEELVRTRAEAKFDSLETKLGIQGYVDDNMRITRNRARNIDELVHINPGDEIRASWEDSHGIIEDWQVKRRFFRIYQKLRERITQREEEGARAFQDLGGFVYQYVSLNRNSYEDRRKAEEKEAKALTMLKEALVRVQRFGKNKCSKYAAVLLGMLNEDNSGYLEVPPDGVHITVEDRDIALGRREIPGISLIRKYRDCTDMPLFTHRPNIKDIEQGFLGDCYLLAGLISVVDHDAEAIMNIMRDNGDGTVTVCFKREETQEDGRRVYTPYYVTVKKTIPVYKFVESDTFSRGALWVKMMEKAYAASGLHLAEAEQRDRRDYDDISGGRAGEFIGLLLGKRVRNHVPYKNSADRISRLLPAVQEPQWDPDPARRYGNENADSIVYEFIRRRIPEAENMFLHMRKPEQNDPDYGYLMGIYKMLLDMAKSCMLHLYIVDAIAREQGTDILKLNSPRKINNWYEKLKNMFRHYFDNRNNRYASLNRDDKFIVKLRAGCVGSDVEDVFRNINPMEFECTMDILRDRHMQLLVGNRQERENGNAAQEGHDYYTVRDRKLYRSINRALQAGSYVTFGTKRFTGKGTGLNGETESGGLVGGHAYAILNTRRMMVGDKEYLFLVVMNPWAQKGVVYDVEADRIRERAVQGQRQGEREEGVFLLDIKTFAEVVRRWDTVPA